MTKEDIQAEIDGLKEEIKEVKGTPCEVWSRVVGYLRPVQSFNVGKKEEYALRKNYDVELKKQ